MFRRFQRLFQTVLTGAQSTHHQDRPQTHATGFNSQIVPDIPTGVSKAVMLPELLAPMGPLSLPNLRPTPSGTEKTAPACLTSRPEHLSLTEICAEQPLTPLLESLYAQARWFDVYRPEDSQFYPDTHNAQLLCQVLPPLLDYQRIQIQVVGLPQKEVSLALSVCGTAQATLEIGDVQPGSFNREKLRIPCEQPVEICFRILSISVGPFALKLTPDHDALTSVLTPALFSLRNAAAKKP
jgi:hypothetical protein